MKIVSWNINGLRSFEKPIKTILDDFNSDIICFQETKTTRDQLTESSAIVDGYSSYFSFSKVKSGYSGVVTYCKDGVAPHSAQEGLSGLVPECDSQMDPQLDREGRCIVTQHWLDTSHTKSLHVFNVYCPFVDSQTGAEERQRFRMNFLETLGSRAQHLQEKGPVIICGDLNISHRRIDHCDPDEIPDFDSSPSRKWLSRLLDSESDNYFVDSFRHIHPTTKKAFSCWNTKISARLTNYGTRIDYILVDHSMESNLNKAEVLQDVMGSDHCPVTMECSLSLSPSVKLPRICSKFLPEFKGTQVKLTNFTVKGGKRPFDDYDTKPPALKRNSRSQTTLRNYFSSSKVQESNPTTDIVYIADDEEEACQVNMEKVAVNATNDASQNTISEEPVLSQSSTTGSSDSETSSKSKPGMNNTWKSLFKSPKAPVCKGHKEPCVLRSVKKDTVNYGRQFYSCARPIGDKTCAGARCNHFEWVAKPNKSSKKV